MLVGRKFRLTSGVHEEPSACALRLNGSVAQHHGSNHLCHVATQMPEEVLQFAALPQLKEELM